MTQIAKLTAPVGWKNLTGTQLKTFIEEELAGAKNVQAVAKKNANTFAVLEYKKIGYIETKNPNLNLNYIIEQAKNDIQIANSEYEFKENEKISFQGFSPKPVFNSANKTIDYGVLVNFGKEQFLNLYKIILVKDGYLVLNISCSPKDKINLADFKIEVDKKFNYKNFNPNNDRVSESKLENVILMNKFF